jgi:glycosyltransferase involved in cell wall biosynthesis
MHIAYLTIDYHSVGMGGGIASYLHVLTRALVTAGHQVTILTLAGNSFDEIVDGVRVVGVKATNWHWYAHKVPLVNKLVTLPIRELEWSWALWRTLRQIHHATPIDVIEAPEVGNTFYRPASDPPLIVRTHGDEWSMQKANGSPTFGGWLDAQLQKRASRRATLISAVSDYQKGEYQKRLGKRCPPIQTVYNPVDLQRFPPINRTDTRPIVLYTGRIERRKGSLTLLDAAQLVAQELPEVQFICIGKRHNSISDSELQAHLHPSVKLLGHIAWTELYPHYAQARLFVMPSWYETFGISVVEAMSTGLSVVATRAGGLPEVVADGETGLLVAPYDVEALAEAILELLREPDRAIQLGIAGQVRAQNFCIEHLLPEFIALYEAIGRRK